MVMLFTACSEEPASPRPFSQFAGIPASPTIEQSSSATSIVEAPPETPSQSPSPLPGASPSPAPARTPPPADSAACSASARVDNEAPAKSTRVTVTGVLECPGSSPVGATMAASWKFKSTTSSCEGVADDGGVASCSRSVGGASSGFRVEIVVTFSFEGEHYTAVTGFTTR